MFAIHAQTVQCRAATSGMITHQ